MGHMVAEMDILGSRLTSFPISNPSRQSPREGSHWPALSHMLIHRSITVATAMRYFE